MRRDVMEYDVLIVGAGPAGLGAAIHLKQLAQATQREISVCILEKGATVGAHILSGAIIDPIALNELIPDWAIRASHLLTPVTEDSFLILGERGSWHIPECLLPPLMSNRGNHIVSLGRLCGWLGEEAEKLGIEIYPGFAGAEILYDESGAVKGVATGDLGVARDGNHKSTYTPGIEIHARYTLIAEGTRGSLTRNLESRFALRDNAQPQKYGIGLKEIWQVDSALYSPGKLLHTLGWPLDDRTGGGGFVYHLRDNRVAVGFVVHLDYRNPHLSPFDEFQRLKTHPQIKPLLENGKRLSYGARTINEGGLQSLPKLVFPGGALIGCSAGFINVPRIKGSHNAIKTGMLAAEAIAEALMAGRANDELLAYPVKLKNSWVWQDLDKVRNVKPALSKFGNVLGMLYGGTEMWLGALGVRLPWTFKHDRADHEGLKAATKSDTIPYPKADGETSFDKTSSIYLSNVHHEEDQPCHLELKDARVPISLNLALYDAPEQRYCPAGVYEIVREAGDARLQINAANCIHCKACDIKDPTQNIIWHTPEGGGGPNYIDM